MSTNNNSHPNDQVNDTFFLQKFQNEGDGAQIGTMHGDYHQTNLYVNMNTHDSHEADNDKITDQRISVIIKKHRIQHLSGKQIRKVIVLSILIILSTVYTCYIFHIRSLYKHSMNSGTEKLHNGNYPEAAEYFHQDMENIINSVP